MACVICGVPTNSRIGTVRVEAIVCPDCFVAWLQSPEYRRAGPAVTIILSASPHFADFVRRVKAGRQNGVTP